MTRIRFIGLMAGLAVVTGAGYFIVRGNRPASRSAGVYTAQGYGGFVAADSRVPGHVDAEKQRREETPARTVQPIDAIQAEMKRAYEAAWRKDFKSARAGFASVQAAAVRRAKSDPNSRASSR